MSPTVTIVLARLDWFFALALKSPLPEVARIEFRNPSLQGEIGVWKSVRAKILKTLELGCVARRFVRGTRGSQAAHALGMKLNGQELKMGRNFLET